MTPEELKERQGYIGASEIGALLGIDPFCTPLKLWGLKTGLIEPDDLSDNEAVEWGTRLERIVSQKFSDKHGVKLIAYKKRFYHPNYAFLSCELDNIIAGTDEIVEIKTVNAWAWKKWENPDELPAKVIAQVIVQMGLSKRNKAWVAVLCGGQKYIEKEVIFDHEFYSTIVEKVKTFWKMVEDKTPPMACADDSESLLALYPTNKSDEIIQGIEELNTAIGRRQELSMHIDQMKEEKEEIENKIKAVIGKNIGVKTESYLATWKPQSRRTVDTAALKTDLIYDKYTKESTTRVLLIKRNTDNETK